MPSVHSLIPQLQTLPCWFSLMWVWTSSSWERLKMHVSHFLSMCPDFQFKIQALPAMPFFCAFKGCKEPCFILKWQDVTTSPHDRAQVWVPKVWGSALTPVFSQYITWWQTVEAPWPHSMPGFQPFSKGTKLPLCPISKVWAGGGPFMSVAVTDTASAAALWSQNTLRSFETVAQADCNAPQIHFQLLQFTGQHPDNFPSAPTTKWGLALNRAAWTY